MELKASFEVDSRLESVAAAREWLAEKARKAGYDSGTTDDLKLAITEATTNIIRHAYGNTPGNRILFSLFVGNEKLELIIRDFGKTFDRETYQPPDLSTPQEGGYGIFLIENLMDEMRYEPSEKGGTLTLVKYRTSKQPSDPELKR